MRMAGSEAHLIVRILRERRQGRGKAQAGTLRKAKTETVAKRLADVSDTKIGAHWIARQITEAFPWSVVPDHLIRDRDGSYGHTVTRRLAAMGIPASTSRCCGRRSH
jgi:hypothetical protein